MYSLQLFGVLDYRDFSAGINFVQMEADRVDAADTFDWAGGADGDGASGTPAFDTIVDGDLDNDEVLILDPDNDNDETQTAPIMMMITMVYWICGTLMMTTMGFLTFAGMLITTSTA